MTTYRIANRAADEALANVGVHEEGGENKGKSVSTYLASVGITFPAPWCAAFQYFRFSDAAKDLGAKLPAGFPRSGYCPDFENWGKKNGHWVPVASAKADPSKVQRGDLVLFYFATQGRIAHIGVVLSVSATGVTTVEGNTSDGSGVNRDGDGVYKRFRTWASLGTRGGFARVPDGAGV